MKEHPILFSAPMVRAILAGTKTQTRRVVKPQPIPATTVVGTFHHPDDDDGRGPRFWSGGPDPSNPGHSYIQPDWAIPCPYGQPGDRLWVRETYWRDEEDGSILYAANPDDFEVVHHNKVVTGSPRYNWKPSIFMPRWASRITLEVTSVRVERLQDISEADARSEGVEQIMKGRFRIYGRETDGGDMDRSARTSYRSLWESINGPGSWGANPWVWVVEFKRVQP